MRLIDMLMPRPQMIADEAPKRVVSQHKRDTSKANELKHAQSLAKYKAVIGDKWTGTRTIENRLGYTRSSSLATLRQYEAQGEIECRPAGGAPFNRRSGYEWRCKK